MEPNKSHELKFSSASANNPKTSSPPICDVECMVDSTEHQSINPIGFRSSEEQVDSSTFKPVSGIDSDTTDSTSSRIFDMKCEEINDSADATPPASNQSDTKPQSLQLPIFLLDAWPNSSSPFSFKNPDPSLPQTGTSNGICFCRPDSVIPWDIHEDSCAICKQSLDNVYPSFNEFGHFKPREARHKVKGKCGHIFHQQCIDTWLKTSTVCPVDGTHWAKRPCPRGLLVDSLVEWDDGYGNDGEKRNVES